MLSEEVLEKVVTRLTNRIEQANTYILEQIGNNIKKIGTVSPSKARQLEQMLKYGGDYDKIVKKLAEITELSEKDIKDIFEEVAKNDYQFAKKFYDYRDKKFIPYEKNDALKKQVALLTNEATKEFRDIVNTKGIGFTVLDKKTGKEVFKPLKNVYNEIIEEAVLNLSQGKTTFYEEMNKVVKQLSQSGVKKLDYESGRAVNIESAVRQHIRGSLRNLHNETQQKLGEEFKANGVEISVHLYPAPDHALVQGKQFSNKQFNNFQNDKDAVSYDGTKFPAIFEDTGRDRRSISQYNCYHTITPIILGVNKPEFTNEQLKQIREDNLKGFTFEGKHYTSYAGTQLQRQLETAIRKAKDEQIMARASGIPENISNAQRKINQLSNKYKQLVEASGLPTRVDRMRVSGYHKVKVA